MTKDEREILLDYFNNVMPFPQPLDNSVYSCEKSESIRSAIITLIEELNKEIPEMVYYEGDGYYDGEIVYDYAECPNCQEGFEEGERYWQRAKYCPMCGQALKWE